MSDAVVNRVAEVTPETMGTGSKTETKRTLRRLAIATGALALAPAATWFGYGWWSAGDWRAVQHLAAGKRHRQFHQDRAVRFSPH
jgi:hypothetical protein